MKKNLVMSVAKGYAWHVLEPFVNSFQKNCPDAELVLFVDEVSAFTREKLIRSGVTLEKFPDNLHGIPNNKRWKVFLDFLEAYGDDYEQILITDSRDVIFQADIFAPFKNFSNWLGCATEGDDIRGSKSGVDGNYTWLVGCFGKNVADSLADKKAICCGTVIGSSREMKIFCRELWKILEHRDEDIFDQAAMNYLVYNGLLPIENIFEMDVDSGEIFTIGTLMMQKPVAVRRNFILHSKDFSVPAVVHQYDRSDKLTALVDKIYRDRDFSFDERFTDTRSFLEQVLYLLYVNETANAVHLFMKIFFSSTDLGNYANLLIEIWKTAAKKNFSKAIEILELSVQTSFLSPETFSDIQLDKIHKLLIYSAKNHHAIDPDFKKSFAEHLLKIVEKNLANGAPAEYCFRGINMIEALELPPDKNFQRVFDEVNQILARNVITATRS